ncbi:MAG: hypothetical protein OEZ68_15720 [Gammaproteobacteria bacterium]|nr:hypothetical protein [Gammaproteobacteria bacterium]MDH5802249.1 hypothetical protein [Gammaproteobacteria bacterium]
MHTETQIANQIEGRILIDIHFPDCVCEYGLISQDSRYWIEQRMMGESYGSREVSKETYNTILSLTTDREFYNTDPLVIKTDLDAKEFFGNYFKYLPQGS